MKEYSGELPKNVAAQIEEHTNGGFILFRIGKNNEVITDLSFDDEMAYLALVKKATSTLSALNKIDDIKAFQALASGLGPMEDGEEDDADESDLLEEDEDEDDED